MKKSVIAAGLMILPLVIAAAITYWPRSHAEEPLTNVVVLPATVQGSIEGRDLADEIANTMSRQLEDAGVAVAIQQTSSDYSKMTNFRRGSAVLLTSMTIDAGIFQLDLQLIEPGTRKVIWGNSYQSPRDSYPEMLTAAGNALGRAIKNYRG